MTNIEHMTKLTSWPTNEMILFDLREAIIIKRETEKFSFEFGYDANKFRTRIVIDKEAFFVQETPEQIMEKLIQAQGT